RSDRARQRPASPPTAARSRHCASVIHTGSLGQRVIRLLDQIAITSVDVLAMKRDNFAPRAGMKAVVDFYFAGVLMRSMWPSTIALPLAQDARKGKTGSMLQEILMVRTRLLGGAS